MPLPIKVLRLAVQTDYECVNNSQCGPGELHPLAALHVGSISLDYKEVGRRDRYGNQFRYQAASAGTDKRTTRRLACDVFLVPAP